MSSTKIVVMLIAVFAMCASCASMKAPSGTVPTRKGLEKEAYGAWMTLTLDGSVVSGELIAVDNDSIYVLPENGLQKFATSSVDTAKMVLYRPDTGKYIAWTAVTSVATIANGAFLVITFPITVITGVVTSSVEGDRINFLDRATASWEEMSKFARFPQGLPPGIDLGSLRPRKLSTPVKF
jgi:hypothetical protein